MEHLNKSCTGASRRWLWLLVVVIWFGNIEYRKLIEPDEGRYAEIPREMAVSGDWVTPRLNNLKYFEKPPLQYWATATAYIVFGEHQWTSRLWTALTGFAGLLLVWFAGTRLFGREAGCYAALLLCSSLLYALMGHINTLDMGVTFFITLGIVALLLAQRDGADASTRRNWMWLAWVTLGLAVLSKGLMGLVLPGAALVIYSILQRDIGLWKRMNLVTGLLLCLLALVPLLGPALLPALNLALTGHAASATTTVKWLVGNPYYGSWPSLVATVRANLATFFDTLLDGREWSAVFVPTGARPFAVAALLAIPLAGWSRGKRWRAGVVLIVALGMLVPCTYLSFLWNRLRYLWPFAFAWTVGFACAARLLGDLVALFSREGEKVAWLAAGFGAGALATHLSWTIDDLAGSASGIDRQQVALGRWAAAHLPADARIGVNDTGAVAYFSGRRTFDVVGLTTPGEARYWVAGAGARYEHYERLGRASRASLPTHFIVYPEWMACEPVLGEELHSETVTDQTILGGQTMTAYEASWRVLGAADRPEEPPASEPLDELDVADLESEAAHAYVLGTAVETDCVVLSTGEGERLRADGARVRRASDEATLALRPGAAATVVVRLASSAGATVDVEAEGERVATLEVGETDWDERAIVVPARLASPHTRLRLVARDEGRFGVAHYWAYAGGATPLGDRAAGERPARPAAP